MHDKLKKVPNRLILERSQNHGQLSYVELGPNSSIAVSNCLQVT